MVTATIIFASSKVKSWILYTSNLALFYSHPLCLIILVYTRSHITNTRIPHHVINATQLHNRAPNPHATRIQSKKRERKILKPGIRLLISMRPIPPQVPRHAAVVIGGDVADRGFDLSPAFEEFHDETL